MNKEFLMIREKVFNKENLILLIPSVVFFLVVYISNGILGGYGYFQDELYYIACSKHLDFGYVDHPPLSVLILFVVRMISGDSIAALRFIPALSGALTVFFSGIIARKLDGNLFAQLLASTVIALSPIIISISGFYSMNVFELLIMTALSLILIEIIKNNKPKLWIVVGVLIGFGLENKYTMALYVITIIIGLLFAPHRKNFLSGWFWLGGAIAIVLFIPNLIWEIRHNFIFLEFSRNADRLVYYHQPPLTAFFNQVNMIGFFKYVLVITGFYFFLVSKNGKKYRVFSITYLLLLVMFFISFSGRADRLAGIFPVLLAGGSVMIGLLMEKISINGIKNLVKTTIIAFLVIANLGIIPIVCPILPKKTLAEYSKLIGLQKRMQDPTQGGENLLPQLFAQRCGWDEYVSEVAKIYEGLSPEDKKEVAIFSSDYGRCASIDLLGGKYNLPQTIGAQNNYHLWGYRDNPCKILIVLGNTWKEYNITKYYRDVKKIGEVSGGEYSVSWMRNVPVFLCKNPIDDISQIWPRIGAIY